MPNSTAVALSGDSKGGTAGNGAVAKGQTKSTKVLGLVRPVGLQAELRTSQAIDLLRQAELTGDKFEAGISTIKQNTSAGLGLACSPGGQLVGGLGGKHVLVVDQMDLAKRTEPFGQRSKTAAVTVRTAEVKAQFGLVESLEQIDSLGEIAS